MVTFSDCVKENKLGKSGRGRGIEISEEDAGPAGFVKKKKKRLNLNNYCFSQDSRASQRTGLLRFGVLGLELHQISIGI
ncbi:hypothetical protein SADUNF_Sadunf08G0145100 [Salix dunnii]|uniref:Uncharacterized protein n=1 Tax=Salix dunnii TaxID=1413687 RepID=A0A835JYD3_9ROSI|nr:hypothetical protein SADUNF_Sadunf08G0145100 [Salix dunnii]